MSAVPASRLTAGGRQPAAPGEGPLPWGTPDMLSDPYPHYHRLRAEAPVCRDPLGFWLVSRHADVSALLRDPRMGKDFSVVEGNRVSAIRGGPGSPMVAEITRWMLNRDPPDHTRLRSLAARAFTRQAVERLRTRIRQIVDDLLAPVAERGSMDVVADFAYVLPVTVICELLGLPMEDRDRCRAWAEAVSRGLDPVQTEDSVAQADAAVLAVGAYVKALLPERRRTPGDDLLTALLAAEDEGSQLTEEELVSTVNLLFFAGHQTTRDLIGNGILALLRCPAEAARARSDPSLIRNTVEELLRYDGSVQMTPRYARQAVTLGGVEIAAGDQVTLLLAAANRDPERFTDPDTLDVGRPEASAHVSFGGGAHFCLGAPLARVEAQIAIPALLALPGLELVREPRWRPQIALRSLEELQVCFRPCSWPQTQQLRAAAPVRSALGAFAIRDAASEDLQGAASVMLTAYREYEPVPLPADWVDAWEAYWRDIGDVRSRLDEAELIVAVAGERIVGAVTFYPEASRSKVVDWPPGWALVRLLAVSPESRRQGIGRALTEECLRRARLQSTLAIGLHTDPRMPVPQRLYAEMGFRRAPELDYRPVPDFAVMGWRLDLRREHGPHPT